MSRESFSDSCLAILYPDRKIKKDAKKSFACQGIDISDVKVFASGDQTS